METTVNLLGYNREDMQAFFEGLGERRFRADQVLQWIHQFGVADFGQMTNLSKALRERLSREAVVAAPEVVTEQQSSDGTRKWLLRLADGNCIETVFIPEPGRSTLCVSSQVGCALDCSFCSTAKQGFGRNLDAAEIIGQVWVAARHLGQTPQNRHVITNVVMMGMGEPLLNFDNVVKAMDLMMDDLAYGMSRRRVTLSTAGVVPAIARLKQRSPVSLAVSLHAPDNALRDQLVPINRKYRLEQLMEACRRFADGDKQTITFEYVMLAGVNDSEEHARQLVRLLRGMPAKVNLIPFNPFPGAAYQRPTQEAIDRFRAILVAADIITVTRKTRGDDIDAACGQLVGRVTPRAARHQRQTAELKETTL